MRHERGESLSSPFFLARQPGTAAIAFVPDPAHDCRVTRCIFFAGIQKSRDKAGKRHYITTYGLIANKIAMEVEE